MKLWSKTRTRILLPAIGGIALIGLGGAALAKPGKVAAPGAEGRGGGLCAKLECTDQQKDELKAVMQELRADSKGDREAIQRLRKQIATEFAKDSPDEAAMHAAMAQIATHENEMKERLFDAFMEVHDVLDADQRAELVKMLEHRGPRALMHGGKRGKGKGKGKRGDGKGKKQAE